MMEVVPGVYKLSGPWDQADLGANVYLVAEGGELTLIDSGYAGKAVRILKRVHNLGFTAHRITHIIVTHNHPDHVGSLAALKKMTGAKVIAHQADAPYIEGRLPQPGPFRPALYKALWHPLLKLLQAEPATVDIAVSDNEELPVAGGIRVIHTPGHTPGSICIYLKQKRLMFTGDLIARRLDIKLPSLAFTADIPQLLKSIHKLAGIEFDVACFGHGWPLKHDASRKVKEFAGKLRN
ncbi:MAG: MBL fold metallo-hydrolase [Dehalococcoidia bacterium]|nr:MBL fold metallo-hydrolase [Dehalococcoidia bacterium]MDD5493302.1 MBL fold metallo-hydrolase [Dehalococcoidia bacterium]